MGACATKPKTLEGKAPEEATPIEAAPKVALETTMISNEEVVADQAPEKVVEEVTAIAELPPNDDAIVMQDKEEEVEEKIVEEKPSAVAAEVNNTEVVEETIEVKNTEVDKGTTEVKNTKEEKPIQS
ncbi:uncharacterized protein LOC127777922 [Oryza glaberrima]|uniref:Uncharacterized protein n=2 Tax=Oryza TaxID=4527 RepID=A0A0D3GC68_9ORYZ|nr:uncharacterized protein LOC127777922 [Oryza glaberrima]